MAALRLMKNDGTVDPTGTVNPISHHSMQRFCTGTPCFNKLQQLLDKLLWKSRTCQDHRQQARTLVRNVIVFACVGGIEEKGGVLHTCLRYSAPSTSSLNAQTMWVTLGLQTSPLEYIMLVSITPP